MECIKIHRIESVYERKPEKAAQAYWINTSENAIIVDQIKNNHELQSELEKLINKKKVIRKIDPWLLLREIAEESAGVWTLLLSAGYLKGKWKGEENIYELEIPNKEIERFFKKQIKLWIENKIGTKMWDIAVALDGAINRGKVEIFAEKIKEYIERSMSYFDIEKKEEG